MKLLRERDRRERRAAHRAVAEERAGPEDGHRVAGDQAPEPRRPRVQEHDGRGRPQGGRRARAVVGVSGGHGVEARVAGTQQRQGNDGGQHGARRAQAEDEAGSDTQQCNAEQHPGPAGAVGEDAHGPLGPEGPHDHGAQKEGHLLAGQADPGSPQGAQGDEGSPEQARGNAAGRAEERERGARSPPLVRSDGEGLRGNRAASRDQRHGAHVSQRHDRHDERSGRAHQPEEEVAGARADLRRGHVGGQDAPAGGVRCARVQRALRGHVEPAHACPGEHARDELDGGRAGRRGGHRSERAQGREQGEGCAMFETAQ